MAVMSPDLPALLGVLCDTQEHMSQWTKGVDCGE